MMLFRCYANLYVDLGRAGNYCDVDALIYIQQSSKEELTTIPDKELTQHYQVWTSSIHIQHAHALNNYNHNIISPCETTTTPI